MNLWFSKYLKKKTEPYFEILYIMGIYAYKQYFEF
jgi:hypothetical protein